MYVLNKVAASSSLDEAKNILEDIYEENPDHWPNGLYPEQMDGGLYLVRQASTDAPVGFVGWQERVEDFKKVGYYSVGIKKSHRRNGYAKAAIKKLIQEKSARVDTVKALILEDNVPSRGLADKLNVEIEIEKKASMEKTALTALTKLMGKHPSAAGLTAGLGLGIGEGEAFELGPQAYKINLVLNAIAGGTAGTLLHKGAPWLKGVANAGDGSRAAALGGLAAAGAVAPKEMGVNALDQWIKFREQQEELESTKLETAENYKEMADTLSPYEPDPEVPGERRLKPAYKWGGLGALGLGGGATIAMMINALRDRNKTTVNMPEINLSQNKDPDVLSVDIPKDRVSDKFYNSLNRDMLFATPAEKREQLQDLLNDVNEDNENLQKESSTKKAGVEDDNFLRDAMQSMLQDSGRMPRIPVSDVGVPTDHRGVLRDSLSKLVEDPRFKELLHSLILGSEAPIKSASYIEQNGMIKQAWVSALLAGGRALATGAAKGLAKGVSTRAGYALRGGGKHLNPFNPKSAIFSKNMGKFLGSNAVFAGGLYGADATGASKWLGDNAPWLGGTKAETGRESGNWGNRWMNYLADPWKDSARDFRAGHYGYGLANLAYAPIHTAMNMSGAAAIPKWGLQLTGRALGTGGRALAGTTGFEATKGLNALRQGGATRLGGAANKTGTGTDGFMLGLTSPFKGVTPTVGTHLSGGQQLGQAMWGLGNKFQQGANRFLGHSDAALQPMLTGMGKLIGGQGKFGTGLGHLYNVGGTISNAAWRQGLRAAGPGTFSNRILNAKGIPKALSGLAPMGGSLAANAAATGGIPFMDPMYTGISRDARENAWYGNQMTRLGNKQQRINDQDTFLNNENITNPLLQAAGITSEGAYSTRSNPYR
jgi:predicted acetyltransferase